MINNKKNAFTLVELLAVIAVLGLIIIIAIPKVMETLNTQKKRTLELTTKSIIKAAEEKYIENSAYGINEEITCESVSNITSNDFDSCKIFFDDVGNASVTIVGKGRYDGINVCNGTKENTVASKEECPVECTSDEMLVENAVVTKPYIVKNISSCATYFTNLVKGMGAPDEVVADFVSVCNGNIVEEMTFNDLITSLLEESLATELYLVKNNIIEGKIESSCKKARGLQCTYDGDLVKGTEFTHNQYTYRYKEASVMGQIIDIEEDGWSVTLTDKESTAQVNTQVCSYINGKPLVSTSAMFVLSHATSVDLSSWETDNVKDMSSMFRMSAISEIKGLSSLETHNVTNVSDMFNFSRIQTINLSVLDLSKVTNMSGMFQEAFVKEVDLSSLDLNNVKDMSKMFRDSLIKKVNFSGINTKNVTNMQTMFFNTGINNLDLSDLDTDNVTNMNSMFANMTALQTIHLANFDTSNVIDMSSMFAASNATTLDLSSFDTSKVTNMNGMFSNSKATTGYARTQADADKLNASSNKPDTLTFVVKTSS